MLDDLAPAPIDHGDEYHEPTLAELVGAPAPVFPTEADVNAIIAKLSEADDFATGSERARTRAVQAEIDRQAATLAKDSHAGQVARARLAHERQERLAVLAPATVFPTEANAVQLRAAIPNLTDTEFHSIIAAGHAAYLASVAAGDVVLDVPEESA